MTEVETKFKEFLNIIREGELLPQGWVGDVDKIMGLIDYEFATYIEPVTQRTALMYAAIHHLGMRVTKALVDNQANIHLQDNLYGKTALHHAVLADQFEVVEYLIGLGADTNFKDYREHTVFDYLREEDADMKNVIERAVAALSVARNLDQSKAVEEPVSTTLDATEPLVSSVAGDDSNNQSTAVEDSVGTTSDATESLVSSVAGDDSNNQSTSWLSKVFCCGRRHHR